MRTLLTFVSSAFLLLCMSSCGSKSQNDNMTADEMELFDEWEDSFGEVYILGSYGMGPIEKGMHLRDIPESVDGLYDSFTVTKFSHNDHAYVPLKYRSWASFKRDGNQVFTAGFDALDKVIQIATTNPEIPTPIGAFVGMPENELIDIPGVECVNSDIVYQYKNDMMKAYKFDDIYFFVENGAVVMTAVGDLFYTRYQ